MDRPSNSALFLKKQNILEACHIANDHFQKKVSLEYHGVPMTIHTQSQDLIVDLESFLPREWFNHENDSVHIYLQSPNDFGFNLSEFSDESSQDCFSMNHNSWAIQRDFAAKIFDNNKVFLVCQERLSDGFYNFLRWYISEKLIERNKFVIHASCVLDNNGLAHIFLGHSGAGKTTVTGLSSPRRILGDDMNIISINNNDELMVEAGAIGGLFNSMIGYGITKKVKGVYWLNQADENRLIELDVATASQRLLASFANLHWPTLPDKTAQKLINVSLVAAKTTAFYTMNFKKSSEFWELLE